MIWDSNTSNMEEPNVVERGYGLSHWHHKLMCLVFIKELVSRF
jgi:hypothetical protein